MKPVIPAALCALLLLYSVPTRANHYYGIVPGDNDPPIDAIDGVLFGNGSVNGILAASAPQPDEGFDHVVFYARSGDSVTVDTLGSNQDPGLAILLDTGLDGIIVGDAPPNTGSELTFLASDDDGAGGLNSLINFVAPYTGAYLASIAEIGGSEMSWVINVSGSTYVPEPGSVLLFASALPFLLTWRRRVRSA